jgi:hypothetical protein
MAVETVLVIGDVVIDVLKLLGAKTPKPGVQV